MKISLQRLDHVKKLLIAPKGASEDTRRREYILNLLLLGSIALSAIALFSAFLNVLARSDGYRGESLLVLCIPMGFFLCLYALSRIRYPKIAASVFIATYYILATYTLAKWGILLPQGILIYAVIIVMTGVLLSTNAAFFVTCLLSVTLLTLRVFEIQGTLHPNLYWIHESGGIDDAIVFSATLFIILIVSWLSNREIYKSLERARKSEASLKEQRDSLEIIVEERTQELRAQQREENIRLYRFAEFGQLTSGLLHDLTTPLTTLSLNLERLSNHEDSQTIKRAIDAARRMHLYIDAARKQLSPNVEITCFKPIEEIQEAQKILAHRSRKAHIKFTCSMSKDIKLYGDPIKFNRLATNLIANAIDAYDTSPPAVQKNILLTLEKNDTAVIFKVADQGCGIQKKEQGNIFLPFYTTKSNQKGIGMGLAICKEIVEKDFHGSIEVSSSSETGTTFTITIPITHIHEQNS
ncbi:MAG TPA: HAMP domain-containing sensor histidine kinase [Patescibacteria group bacterium]